MLTGRRGAWLFTAAVAVAAIAVFVLLIVPAPAYDPEDQLPWPVFAIAFGLAEIAVVHLMVRSQAVTVSLSEIPLVIGFYFLAPTDLVIAQFVGSAVALILFRRQPPLKLVFNLSIFSLGSSLAILVFGALAPMAPTSLILWWMASFLGTVTVVLVSAIAISVAISIDQRQLEMAALRRGLGYGLLAAFVNTSIALVAVVFLVTEPDELWLLAAPAVVGVLGYRAFNIQRQRHARLEFLYECSEILTGPLLDEPTLVRLLQRTRDMFGTATVEAMLVGEVGGGAATRVSIERDGRSRAESVDPGVVARRHAMLDDGTGVPGGRLVQLDDAARVSAGARAGDTIIVPLRGASGDVGTLMVAERLDDLGAFDTDDLRVLETIGSRLGLVAENSGLVERLEASLAEVGKLAAIVESADDAMVAVDLDGRIAAWNPSAEVLFGQRAEVVVGRVGSEVLSELERAPFRESFLAVTQGAAVRDLRMEWLRGDGLRIPLSITMSPIRGADGQVSAVSAILRDESDRARAEAALQASAELFRTVIDESPVGMGVAGIDHRWVRINPALRSLLGIPADDAVDESALERIHPDDLATIERLEDRLYDGGPAIRSVERRYIGLDGRVVLTQATVRPIQDPSSGAPVAFYTIEDITERRRAEQEARSTEERFRSAALRISAVRDPAKVLRAVLESARETLRAEYAAIATFTDDGSVVEQMEVDGVDSDGILERLGRLPSATGVFGLATKLGSPIRLRDLRAHPDFRGLPAGHPRMISFLAVPIPHEGAVRATLVLANKLGEEGFTEADESIALALATHAAVCLVNARINARALDLVNDLDRANLELIKANDAKSRFLASVAHELRTPLHAILVAGELVHDPPAGPLSDDQVRSLGLTIESSGRLMVRLIDDLVDLARIEAGRLDLRPTRVIVGDVLAEIAAELAHTAKSRGIDLQLPSDPGLAVLADPVRLRQILSNLIANALKYTDRDGRVWVDVGSTRAVTRIAVHDTGIGIAPEDLERAFQPFEQVSQTSTPGAGLGLAISRSLAELHGGTLTATSVPGVGSTFVLSLPRRLVAEAGQPASASLDLRGSDAGHGRPILVVEDDETAMGLATDLLRMTDYEVWQARGLGEATAMLAAKTPALVLVDVRLGDGSGLDLVEQLRSDGVNGDLPILVLSADAMPDDVKRARAAGCSDFLAKPVSPRVLLTRITDLIGGQGEVA